MAFLVSCPYCRRPKRFEDRNRDRDPESWWFGPRPQECGNIECMTPFDALGNLPLGYTIVKISRPIQLRSGELYSITADGRLVAYEEHHRGFVSPAR